MMQQGGPPMARPDQHFQMGGGQMNGNPVMFGGGQMQGQQDPRLNGRGQIYGQGSWGPGSQWYANHRMGMQGTPPMAGGLMGALGPLGGGQMQGGPAGMPMPFGGQNPGGNMMPMGGMQQPGGMNQMQWQHILQMMQGQPGLNPLQRGFDGQMPQ